MNKANSDISVIVTAHHEGRLAHRTMRSLFRAVEYARERNVSCEIVVVMDKPDDNTKDYFSRYDGSKIVVRAVDFGDPGLSRNYGVSASSGKYIAFLDADDLFGETWLKAAYEEARNIKGEGVFHPEYVICFERENWIMRCKNMDDSDFYLSNLIEHNCWNSVHFLAQKSLLIENPFIGTPIDSGFGYEDWHWNCEIIAKGIRVRLVPETCVFYRKKKYGSRNAVHNHNNVLIPPSKLFAPAKYSALLEDEKIRKTLQQKRPE